MPRTKSGNEKDLNARILVLLEELQCNVLLEYVRELFPVRFVVTRNIHFYVKFRAIL